MKGLNQLEIPKRGAHCFNKQEPLAPGMDIYSFLHEQEENQLARNDYCPACWHDLHATLLAQPNCKGYWKSKIELKKQQPESTRTARALLLLKDLLGKPDSSPEEIFVLALFLAHARLLALRQEFQQEGNNYFLYEVVRQEEFITVKSINLSQIQIETIQKSLAQKL